MSEGHQSGLLSGLFAAAVTLPAVVAALDPDAEQYFEQHWRMLVCVGVVGAVLYLGLQFKDARPNPPWRNMAGQAVVTFIVTGCMPVVFLSVVPGMGSPLAMVLSVLGGGPVAYVAMASVEEYAQAARNDGSAGKAIGGAFRGLLLRLAGANPATVAPPSPGPPAGAGGTAPAPPPLPSSPPPK